MNPTRRTFLRAAGVSLALPWLEALAGERKPRRRMVCICNPLGLHAPHLFPEKAGKDYKLTPYLDVIKEFRNDFTVISGLAHPEVGSSHDSIYSFLTAAPHPEIRAGFKNSVSLDQVAADQLGGETRVPSLTLSCEGFTLSWTKSGAIVPSDVWPSRVFARLFLEGKPDEVKAQARRLRTGRSILDAVGDRARALKPALGSSDREKVDEYFGSVRELERRLAVAQEWSKKPKPKVNAKPPQDVRDSSDVLGRARLMLDLIHLAFQTDSTRIVTLMLAGTSSVPKIPGVSLGHHNLSHHGKDPKKIEQLKTVEVATMKTLHAFLKKLKGTEEEGVSLLDRTMVFFSSNLGNASSHSTRNLPVLMAGGGFMHGRHLAYAPDNAPPLSNLYLTMLHRLGVDAERFGSSTGTLTDL